MGYKDLLIVLDGSARARQRLQIAALLAERFGAHLVALYPTPYPTPQPAFGYYSPTLLDPLYRAIDEKLREQADEMRGFFEHLVDTHGISGEWRAPGEEGEHDPAIHARYVDLAILGQIDPDLGGNEVFRVRPELVALTAGRPVLVIPYAGEFPKIGQRVLVGWNASREATRAVNDAMPLLTAAEKVTVMVIDPHGRSHGDVPGADISLHLARHGVKAEVERTTAPDIGVGDALLSRAADLGVDLLVMGLYGHSRAREFFLSGASRSVLETMTVPVLVSH